MSSLNFRYLFLLRLNCSKLLCQPFGLSLFFWFISEISESDLKKRVAKLEDLLEESAREKDELRNSVLKLTEEVASLRTKVEFLEKENERLKMR